MPYAALVSVRASNRIVNLQATNIDTIIRGVSGIKVKDGARNVLTIIQLKRS